MRKPIIAIKLTAEDYDGLTSLANRVVASMTGNLSFATPAVPLLTLGGASDDVTVALGVWRPLENRGSHEALNDLRQKSLILLNLLIAEADYVTTTAIIAAGTDYESMAAIMLSSGYALKSDPAPQGPLQMVQGFHHFVSRVLSPNQVKLKWGKPLDLLSRGNVRGYRVMRSSTNVITDAVQIAITTATSYIDTNDTGVQQRWTYFIIPFNNNGDGVPSDGVTVTVAGA